jgi:hypothetical protein
MLAQNGSPATRARLLHSPAAFGIGLRNGRGERRDVSRMRV